MSEPPDFRISCLLYFLCPVYKAFHSSWYGGFIPTDAISIPTLLAQHQISDCDKSSPRETSRTSIPPDDKNATFGLRKDSCPNSWIQFLSLFIFALLPQFPVLPLWTHFFSMPNIFLWPRNTGVIRVIRTHVLSQEPSTHPSVFSGSPLFAISIHLIKKASVFPSFVLYLQTVYYPTMVYLFIYFYSPTTM